MSSETNSHIDSKERNPIDALFDEFVTLRRDGQPLTIDQFADRHPDFESEVRRLFPIMEIMDEACEQSDQPEDVGFADLSHEGRILGDYRIIGEIGHGGMGVVYEAEHVTLGRRVALKVLPSLMDRGKYRQRFLREAQAAAKLHHSNIVPVFDFGEHESTYYYVMQFIDGAGLDTIIESIKQIPDERDSANVADDLIFLKSLSSGGSDHSKRSLYFRHIARIGSDVANALDYAHRQGIVHRDIKPSNLILDGRGNIWVTDFGLAKADDEQDLTGTGDLIGTLRYMPPESLAGQADARGDIYSLGLSLYEFAALEPAFGGSSRHELLRRIGNDSPNRLSGLAAGIPSDLETIIHKAIDREPAARYESARYLADDLQRFLNDEPIHARRTSWLTKTTRWARRNKLVASLISAIALLLVVGLIGTTVFLFLISGQRDSAQRELFASLLAESASHRQSGAAGQRLNSLQAVADASKLLPFVADDKTAVRRLRDETIGSLGLFDVGTLKSWPTEHDGLFAFSPTHRRYIQRRSRGEPCVVCDANTGERVCELQAKTDWVEYVAFPHPDRVIVCDNTHRAFLCDAITGRILHEWKDATRLYVSADGTSYILRNQQTGRFDIGRIQYDSAKSNQASVTRKPTNARAPKAFHAAFSPDNNFVAIANSYGPSISVRDMETFEYKFRVVQPAICRGICWHPNGEMLATTSGSYANVWSLGESAAVVELRHPTTVDRVCFSPDGELLATSTWAYDTRFWDVQTGQELLVHSGKVGSFSGDHVSFAKGTSLGIWKLTDRTTKYVMPGTQTPTAARIPTDLAVHPHSQVVAIALKSGIRLYNAKGRTHVDLPCAPCSNIAFTPDGRKMISAHRDGVWSWPLHLETTDRQLFKVGEPTEIVGGNGKSLANAVLDVDPDGRFLHVLADRKLHHCALQEEKVEGEFLVAVNAFGVSVARNGLAAIGNHHGNSVDVYSIDDGKKQFSISTPANARAMLSPCGKWLAATYSSRIEVYDTENWQKRYSISDLDVAWPCSFSSDSELLLVTVRNSNAILLVDAATGIRLAQFPLDTAHTPRVTPPVLSKDKRFLTSLNHFNGIAIWDLFNVRKELRLHGLDWEEMPLTTKGTSDLASWELQVDLGEKEVPFVRKLIDHSSRDLHFAVTKQLLDSLITDNPNKALYQFASAEYLLENYYFRDAEDDIDMAISLDPDFAESYRLRATLRKSRHAFREAAADLKQYLEREPDDVDEMYRYVNLQALFPAAERDAEQSLHFAKRIESIEPNSPRSLKALGLAYLWASQYQESLDQFARLPQDYKLYSGSHLAKAICFYHVGLPDASQTSWQSALAVMREAYSVSNDRYAIVLAMVDEYTKVANVATTSEENKIRIQAKRLASRAYSDSGMLHVGKWASDRTNVFPGTQWDENQHLGWRCPRPKSTLTIDFDVPAAGAYDLFASITYGPDFGRFRVFVNEDACSDPIDAFSPQFRVADNQLGRFDLRKGANRIRLTSIGKSPASLGYYIGIDYLDVLSIEYDSDSTDSASDDSPPRNQRL